MPGRVAALTSPLRRGDHGSRVYAARPVGSCRSPGRPARRAKPSDEPSPVRRPVEARRRVRRGWPRQRHLDRVSASNEHALARAGRRRRVRKPMPGSPGERAAAPRRRAAISRAVAGDDTQPGAVDVRDPRVGLRAGPAGRADAWSRERPAHVAVGLERGELVLARRDDEATERRPARLAIRRRGVASSRPPARPRRPHPTRRAAAPAQGARRAPAVRARRRRPRGSRRGRPGRAGSAPPRAAATQRPRPRRGAQHPAAGARRAGARANAPATTRHDRSRASCSPGISIRSSSRFTAPPPARRGRAAAAS